MSTEELIENFPQSSSDLTSETSQNSTLKSTKQENPAANKLVRKKKIATPLKCKAEEKSKTPQIKATENEVIQEQGSDQGLAQKNIVEPEAKKTLIDITELKKLNVQDLFKRAEEMGISISGTMLKEEIIFSIITKAPELGNAILGGGVIEVLNEGYAFTRSIYSNYLASSDDVYMSPGQIRKLGLRVGDEVFGELRSPRKEERYLALSKAISINGNVIGTNKKRLHFDSLVPLYPDNHLLLECNKVFMHNSRPDLSPRIIDIVAPLGKGQRALIVAPPKTGKTMLMQNIANSISTNHSDISLIVLLIGERPEEVTDMQRSVKGEVASSTFDEPASRHVQLAELVIERAKRMVENGRDVVILLDSITRLARAYNAVVPSSGKVLTGGVDSNALQRPKRFFGAARNIERGGSLTIIATALVDTGSKMDEVIFEEFKGTGNCDVFLDRKLADKRMFPAIDITRSGTRREELLLDEKVLNKTWILRRILSPMGSVDAMDFLLEKLKKTKSNHDFFESMKNTFVQ